MDQLPDRRPDTYAGADGTEAEVFTGGPGTSVETYVGDVLELVAAIPAGKVLTYGDVAALVGRGGPRQVGQVMARWGSAVPWWRVLRADGRPALGHQQRALQHYADEATPLRPDGQRVNLRAARWQPGLSVGCDGMPS